MDALVEKISMLLWHKPVLFTFLHSLNFFSVVLQRKTLHDAQTLYAACAALWVSICARIIKL